MRKKIKKKSFDFRHQLQYCIVDSNIVEKKMLQKSRFYAASFVIVNACVQMNLHFTASIKNSKIYKLN